MDRRCPNRQLEHRTTNKLWIIWWKTNIWSDETSRKLDLKLKSNDKHNFKCGIKLYRNERQQVSLRYSNLRRFIYLNNTSFVQTLPSWQISRIIVSLLLIFVKRIFDSHKISFQYFGLNWWFRGSYWGFGVTFWIIFLSFFILKLFIKVY